MAISRLLTRPAVSQRERRLVDQRVHRVVRVEVGIEDQVGLVAGLHDERDGGGGQAVVGGQRGGSRRRARRRRWPGSRCAGASTSRGPEPRAQAARRRRRARRSRRATRPSRGGQRRRRLGVARRRRGRPATRAVARLGQQPLGGHDLVDAHALLGAEGDLGVLLGAELPRRVERRRDEHERDDDELARQAQAVEHGDGRAQEQGRQGTETTPRCSAGAPAFLRASGGLGDERPAGRSRGSARRTSR